LQNELHEASVWITAKWLDGIMRNAHWADPRTELAEFGAFQARSSLKERRGRLRRR
jgi:hypothetical protein